MNEVVSKLSSYNIFNNLVPGATFCFLMHGSGLIDLAGLDWAGRLLIFYVVGLALSRLGSILLDPTLKHFGLIAQSGYRDFVSASARDAKIAILLETANTYRTMASACLAAPVAFLLAVVLPRSWLQLDRLGYVGVALVGILFVMAHAKQNKAITRRVAANLPSAGQGAAA